MADTPKNVSNTGKGGGPIVPLKPGIASPGITTQVSSTPILPGGQTSSKYKALGQYSDPFFTGGFKEDRQTMVEDAFDQVQPWYDKLGNGLVKFAGTFADGTLGTAGTIWGLASSIVETAASPFSDEGFQVKGSSLWDNVFTEAGNSLVEEINKNFVNYKSNSENFAGAWSPKNWMTLNFLADNIIGNAGYTASALATGMGMSRLFSTLAPWIASRNVGTALNIARTEGVEALAKFDKLATALRRWDRVQQGVSLGIASMGEASTEAYSAYKESKDKLISQLEQQAAKEGRRVTSEELAHAEELAHSTGNLVYGLNIPLLLAANGLQFGKSLLGFNSEFQTAAKTRFRLTNPEGLLGGYAEAEAKKGFKNAVLNGTRRSLTALTGPLSEAGQEGFQFLASEMSKNYYEHKLDPKGQQAADSWISGFGEAAEKLFTTKEGVANLLGGFGSVVSSPHTWMDVKQALFQTNDNKAQDFQLSMLNSINAKETLKNAYEAASRHASIQEDLNKAVMNDDEFEARNKHNDLVKNYVQSRIMAGRFDLLENEIKQMKAMSSEDFKEFLGLDKSMELDHKKLLDGYEAKAKDMHRTWENLDRVFLPQLYRVDDSKKEAAITAMQNYKEMAWSYLMDARDNDGRINQLRDEVDNGLGGVLSLHEFFKPKTKHTKINDWIAQYNALAVEREVKKLMDPDYANKEEYRTLQTMMGKIKYKINDRVRNNKKSLGLPEYLEKGEPEFLEEYLFSVEKGLNDLRQDTIFRKSLLGTNNAAMVDVSQLLTKLNDLRRLEKRRMMAVQSYNNLTTIVKEGKYLDPMVKNPRYENDTENEPEFIPSEQLFRGDNYKQFAEERDLYRQEQQEQAAQNQRASKVLLEGLDRDARLTRRPDSDYNRLFQNRYAYWYHGNEKVKGFKSMDDDEFSQALKTLEADSHRNRLSDRFDTATPDARERFSREDYIDWRARAKAAEDVVALRNKELKARLQKMATEFAKKYNDIFNEEGPTTAEQFYEAQVAEWRKTSDAEAIKILTAEADKLRVDFGILEQPEEEKPATETGEQIEEQEDSEDEESDPITSLFGPPSGGTSTDAFDKARDLVLTDENYQNWSNKRDKSDWQQFTDQINSALDTLKKLPAEKRTKGAVNEYLKNIKAFHNEDLRKQVVDLISTVVTPAAPKKSSAGTNEQFESNPNKPTSDEEDNKAVNDFLSTLANDPTYLTIRRSDLQTALQYQKTGYVGKVTPGNNMRIDGKEYTVQSVKGDDVAFNGGVVMSLADLEKKAKAGTLERGYINNEYDAEGYAKTKQFDNRLVDPKSEYFLGEGRSIRLFKTQNKKTGEPLVQLHVLGDQGDWVKTDIFYPLDRNKVAQQFRKEVSEKTIDRIQQKVDKLNNALKGRQYVDAKITSDTSNFGRFVFNEGEYGKRKSMSIDKAFGLSFINNPAKTGGVRFGVIANDDAKDNDIRFMTSAGSLLSLNNEHDVHIPQSAIDAVTKNGGKGGQVVALIPTNTKKDGKSVYLPIMLRTRTLQEDEAAPEYTNADGDVVSMNIGQAVVDVLLNPGKPEYRNSFAALYKLGTGVEFNPISPNYEAFYNDDIMHGLLNKVFFASGKTNKVSGYKFPFSINAEKIDKGGIKVTLDITKGSNRTNVKRTEVFITGPDGKVNNNPVDSRIQAYFANTTSERTLDRNLTYGEILDVLSEKPYRVDAKQLAKQPTGSYDAIILDDKGMPTVKRYDSYWHYVDEQQLLTSTVHGIQRGDARFHFVNKTISFNFENIETPKEVEKKTTNKEGQKDTELEKKKEGVPVEAPVMEAKVGTVPGNATATTASTIQALENLGLKTDDQGKVVTSFSAKLRGFGKGGKAMLDPTRVVSVNQFTLVGYDSHVSQISSELYKEIVDLLLQEYNKDRTSQFNRTRLKVLLERRLKDKVESMRYEQKRLMLNTKPDAATRSRIEALEDNIAAYEFALQLYDMDDIIRDTPKEQRDYVSQVSNGKRHYFVGFFNLAVNELFRSKIVDVWANGKQVFDFEEESSLNYTTRYDDGWSFKIDPRETMGKYARIFLETVDEYKIGQDGTLQPVTTIFGTVKRLTYEKAFKALVEKTTGLEDNEVLEFVRTIPEEHSLNTPLMAIYMKLEQIRTDFGEPAYMQAVRQLFNPLLLQTAHQHVMELETPNSRKKQGKRLNGTIKAYNLDRQMINDEILAKWSNNFTNLVQQGKFVKVFSGIDRESGEMTVTYERELIDGKTIVDYLKDRIQQVKDTAGSEYATEAKAIGVAPLYYGLATVYVDMGMPLTGDGSVVGTAKVLADWGRSRGKKKPPLYRKLFAGQRYYGSISEMVTDTLVNYIAQPIEDAVVAGTFNLEEPFKNSTTILNTYAKALKGYFPEVVNANVNDLNGNTRYIYVTRNSLSEMALKMQKVDYLWEVANSNYGRHMPMISAIFKKDDNGNFIIPDDGSYAIDQEALDNWTKISLDYFNGLRRDGYLVQEAKNAKGGSWDIMSLLEYQGAESMDKKGSRGVGNYVVTFGDATTAPYYKAQKQYFKADLERRGDGYRVVLKDDGEVNAAHNVRTQMFQVFLSEVSRSFAAVDKVKAVLATKDPVTIERSLRPGDHYRKVGEGKKANYHMGALAGIYNFGERIYNQMVGADSPIFTTTNIGTVENPQWVVSGIRKEFRNPKTKALNEAKLREVFEGFVDDFVSDMVDARMKQFEPYMNDLIDIEMDDDLASSYKFPLLNNDFVRSFTSQFGRRITVDGVPLQTVFKNDTADEGEVNVYDDKADAIRHSYAGQVFRSMIIDEQVNHFLLRANLSAVNLTDPALFQKPGAYDYKTFYDNWDKRAKGMVTPKINTVTSPGEKFRVIAYIDPKVGDFKVHYSLKDQEKFTKPQREIIEYLRNSPLAAKYGITLDNKGVLTMPERIIGHQIEAMFHLYEDMWKGSSATAKTKARFNSYIDEHLKVTITDGYSIITLKEYLYRRVLDGQIKTQEEFNALWQFYHNPDLRMSDKQFKQLIPLQALKYVMSGGKIEDGEMQRVYGKDAEFVMLPSLTRGSHWDAVREELEAHEGNDPKNVTMGPGMTLKPVSALKLGVTAPVRLFDESGAYIPNTVKGAVITEWDRSTSGKQIQNPDKEDNIITNSIQADKYIHNDAGANEIYGTDLFEMKRKDAEKALEEALAAGDMVAAAQAGLRLGKEDEGDTRKGVFNGEMMRMKFNKKAELMRRDMMKLMDEWGLKFEVAGPEYQKLLRKIGLDKSSTVEDLVKIMNDKDNENSRIAFEAYKIRKQVVMDNIDEMLNDIKSQLLQRKGLTINSTYALRLAEKLQNTMDIPVTFAPNTAQIQAVILSKINKIIRGRKLPGMGLVQMPAFNLNTGIARADKSIVAGSGLKGYTARFDEEGKFVGLNAAEIALPWRFKHPVTGELLDFDKYCNPDGTPKLEMWDPEMLKVVGLRIPGTGPNTLGYFNVVRFSPGYKDTAQVASEVLAQMNSDYDFDKLYSHIYHFEIAENGKITKVQGYLHQAQKGAEAFINSPQARKAALEHHMKETNAAYYTDSLELEKLVNAKILSMKGQVLQSLNEDVENPDDMLTIDDILNNDTIREKIHTLRHSGVIDDAEVHFLTTKLNALEQKMLKAEQEFDMEEFMSQPGAFDLIQSAKQLENALIDSYHIMLNNPKMARRMLKPLTTGWIKDQLTGNHYNGDSLKSRRIGQQFKSPVSQVSNSNTKVSNAGADLMIGIEANAQSLIFWSQHADLTLSKDYKPVLFADEQGNAIEEEEYSREMFAVSKKSFYETIADPEQVQMQGRHRLGRIYGRDKDGNMVPVSEAVQSILQAALDNQTEPLLGIGGIDEQVANALNVMLLLGYLDHAVPLINQPIVRDWVRVEQNFRGIMRSGSRNEKLLEMAQPYFERAGIWQQIQDEVEVLEGNPESFSHVMEAFDSLYAEDKLFNVSELRGMVDAHVMEFENPDFNLNQLRALAMFLRVNKIGADLFTMQQGLSVDSKGFKDTTMVGVDLQQTAFNRIPYDVKLLNVERLTDPRNRMFSTVLASRYGLDVVRNVFQRGRTNMFEDLAPAMRTMRRIAMMLNMRNNNSDLARQVNIGVVQFLLSDTKLYQELINDIAPDVTGMDELRAQLMKEAYAVVPEGEDEQLRYDLKTNTAVTVAGLLDRVQKMKMADGTPYTERYEILANLRPIVQKNNAMPSVVVYLNANNYKQRLDVLLPKSIMQMLQDENKDVQDLAKMLILYAYMVGGTNNPISFLTNIPMEELGRIGFGERIRKKMARLNEMFFDMDNSTTENIKSSKVDDTRLWVAKYLSGDYTNPQHKDALQVLRTFVMQYYQHRVFDLAEQQDLNNVDESEGMVVPILDARLPYVAGTKNGKLGLYVMRWDAPGLFERVDTAGYRFNVAEYSYNEHELFSKTIVNSSSTVAAPKSILPGIDIANEDTSKKLPWEIGRTPASLTDNYLKGWQSPVSEAFTYLAQQADSKIESSEDSKVRAYYEQTKAITKYLHQFIPTNILYGLDPELTVRGKAAAGSSILADDGRIDRVWYNPKQMTRETPVDAFRKTMLHEGTHVALSHAIELIKKVKAGTIDEATAAKELGVTEMDFDIQRRGYERLEALLHNRTVANKIRAKYVEMYTKRFQKGKGKSSMTEVVEMGNELAELPALAKYAVGDVEEFIAFTMSDKDFRDALNQIQYDGGAKNVTIWQRLLQLFKDILGIREGSVLEEAFYDIMSLSEPLKGVTAKVGSTQTTKSGVKSNPKNKALITGESLALPFAVDVIEVANAYNFKQENC